MSTNSPLSYESLKTVLQYMDANTRLKIARHIPSIGRTERVVPLKIDKLQMGQYSIIVNGICYSMSTYRKYPENMEISPYHEDCNRDADYCEDLDRFGAVDKRHENYLNAGDISVTPLLSLHKPDESEIMSLTKDVAKFEEALRKIAQEDGPHYSYKTRFALKKMAEKNTYNLGRARNQLQSLLNRRDNVLPAYEVMVKLEIKTLTNGSSEVHLIKKDLRFYEMFKKLTTSLFGRRKTSIVVNKLAFDSAINVLRLPIDLKLRVRELQAEKDVLNAIAPIIDKRSLPLEAFRLHERNANPEHLTHPWETSARKLIFPYTKLNFPRSYLNFPRRELCLETRDLNPAQFNYLYSIYIRTWLERRMEIGSCISFEKIGVKPKEEMTTLERICQPFDGKKVDGMTIVIPLNQESQLKVSLDVEMVDDEAKDVNGLIKLAVVPI